MTKEKKHQYIIDRFKGFENKSSYVNDLWESLGKKGKPFSMYRNWFKEMYGSIPTNKIDQVYEFTKNYKQRMDGMGGEDTPEHSALLTSGNDLEGTGQIGTSKS